MTAEALPTSLHSSGLLPTVPIPEIDRLIFEKEDWWAVPVDRRTLVADAVRWHLDQSPPYARLADRLGFNAEQLDRVDDLSLVPQIPTRIFKRTQVRSVSAHDCSVFTSSGTSGVLSRVWRDDTTLQRLAGSLRPSRELWGDLADADYLDDAGTMIHLGPARADNRGTWLGYVMTMIEMYTSVRSYLVGDTLLVADAIRDLSAAISEDAFVCVAGPPTFVAALMDHLDARSQAVAGGERVMVVTGGGWKATTHRVMPALEFRARAVEVFGLAGDDQVRDVFNQVELNTAFVECRRHRLHVPPWVEVIVRDPVTLDSLPPGSVGLLSYLDPSATSFPCFIIGDDLGAVDPTPCPCGRSGQTVIFHRRIVTSDHYGCSSRLAKATRIAAVPGSLGR